MAVDGLRALGSCIRCGGNVEFADRPERPIRDAGAAELRLAPYQVMGRPRLSD